MPVNFDPNKYTTDPANFSDKAKEVIGVLQSDANKIKIGDMSIGNNMHYVLYFHRNCGLVAVLAAGAGEFGFQGLQNPDISVNKMLIFLDNIGSTDPDAIPEMQLIRGQMFGSFEGTPEEMTQAQEQGPSAINRFFVAADQTGIPQFNIDFFDAVLQRIKDDSKTSSLDAKPSSSLDRRQP